MFFPQNQFHQDACFISWTSVNARPKLGRRLEFWVSSIALVALVPQRMSNEKRAPGCLWYIVDYTTQLYGDYFISHEIRIPINQPGFQWKVGPGYFSWLIYVQLAVAALV